ncbi:MAG TPA: hypothetical protein VGR56_06810 [Nitrososphaerales archaeon]|nr:hypothetical protein [Nitrososphaerales archaeon]
MTPSRLLWGLLLLLALAVSPLGALALLLVAVILFHPVRREAYGRPAVTLRGEVVRSNSERVIADYFSHSGIRYVYEAPAMSRWVFRRISRPDFYLPDYGVFVEFWGLVNLPNNFARSRYVRSMKWKMAQYHRNGIKFVSLYPSELSNLDAAFRPKLEQSSGRTLNPQAKSFCTGCGQPEYSPGSFCTKCGARL